MIRSIFTACALAFALVSPSFAADMPGGGRYQQEPVVFGPAFGWGGVYVGLNGGYGWGSSDWSGSVATGSVEPGRRSVRRNDRLQHPERRLRIRAGR